MPFSGQKQAALFGQPEGGDSLAEFASRWTSPNHGAFLAREHRATLFCDKHPLPVDSQMNDVVQLKLLGEVQGFTAQLSEDHFAHTAQHDHLEPHGVACLDAAVNRLFFNEVSPKVVKHQGSQVITNDQAFSVNAEVRDSMLCAERGIYLDHGVVFKTADAHGFRSLHPSDGVRSIVQCQVADLAIWAQQRGHGASGDHARR